jgi:hypothetical protein
MSTPGNLRLYDFNLPISTCPCLPAVCPCYLSQPAWSLLLSICLCLYCRCRLPTSIQYFARFCLRLPASICPVCLQSTCIYLPLSACSLHLSSLISRRYILSVFSCCKTERRGEYMKYAGSGLGALLNNRAKA